jgi:2'-5' RNA ligase
MKSVNTWRDLPLRFSKEHNLHVTVLFLGHIADESVIEVCSRVEEVCQNTPVFDLDFSSIELAPEQGMDAKMLWCIGEPNEELKQLRESLEKALHMFLVEKKSFRPHITLARVRKTYWEKLSEIPHMQKPVSFSVSIDSVTVFESTFQKGNGLVFEPLGEYPLADVVV